MNKTKILLVDDEVSLRETISELLIIQNYNVKSACNGQEALDFLEYWIPDLIICDIMMPVMDGSTLLELIKDNNSLNSIPFIFLTAKKENNLMRKCLLDGADDYIAKPFKIRELISIIESKIERFEKIKNSHSNLYLGKKKVFLHEINTPLNGILGPIELLMENQEKLDKKEISAFYESIKISGERLNRTMQNIIFYQNLKNNSIEFDPNSSSEILNAFLKTKEKIFKIYEGQEKRISFEIDKAIIKFSQEHLEFIFFELIDNALKFSSNNKIIIVSGEQFNNEYYELVIRDFGIGLSEQELNKIGASQQFNREKREQQGLGLGLFLSKIIIKKSEGVFTIISKENEGTTIKIFLPLYKNYKS
ncbi:hybrid sensor histidine kinase/response regulator [Flavobacterium sinopsychrotolerans]|uniref:histidine kinase n=1 Tax=Flavobacterium sinopsychrotolerans TaxID=604089 RepID=A0A1H8IFI3_9FLAO|nr:hybrid sensor histidine kinase/response regulator [Flavobacterium sinopsychrotolerans]SEN67002.1 DNA-binding response regulator, OmpR family, contains REC and winged-helix (wHTH) domain [Flavobacterium sinopsychrotolerans]